MTILLSLLAAVFLSLALVSYVLTSRAETRNANLSLATADQKTLVQQSARSIDEALDGQEAAFAQLRTDRDRFQRGLDALKSGSPQQGLAPSPAQVAPQLRAVENAWLAYREGIDRILAAQKDIVGVRELAQATGALLAEISEGMTKAAQAVAGEKAPADQILEAGRQLTRLESMKASMGRLLAGGEETVGAIDAGTKAANDFAAATKTLIAQAGGRTDSAAKPLLQQTGELFAAMRANSDAMPVPPPRTRPPRWTAASTSWSPPTARPPASWPSAP
jgi:twitching motility protein PilJ